MPVSLKDAHYLWHRLTTEDTPMEEVVAKRNRDKGDGLTLEDAKAFMSEMERLANTGMKFTEAMQRVAGAPHLEVVSAPKRAKKAAAPASAKAPAKQASTKKAKKAKK